MTRDRGESVEIGEVGIGHCSIVRTTSQSCRIIERGASRDFRAASPRFQGSNVDANLALVEALRGVADAKGISVAQAAIAWVAGQGADIVPLVGARRRDQLAEALGAADVTLGPRDLAAIERAVPKNAAAGSRYAAHAMAELDSERR
jgi:hypothetical protein